MPVRVFKVLGMLLLLASCSRPLSDESFVKYADRDEQGRYCFTLDMDEESCLYDLDILLVSADERAVSDSLCAVAALQLTSPEGERFRATLDLDKVSDVQKGFFSTTRLYEYGRSLRPVVTGEWELAVSLPSGIDNVRHIDGVGIRLKRNGTR